MDDFWLDLGRRVVLCGGWRWADGMLMHGRGRVVAARKDRVTTFADGRLLHWDWRDGESPVQVPDLRDAATLGCLVAQVRAAHGNPHMYCEYRAGIWHIDDDDTCGMLSYAGTAEAEAWVEAWEARNEG